MSIHVNRPPGVLEGDIPGSVLAAHQVSQPGALTAPGRKLLELTRDSRSPFRLSRSSVDRRCSGEL
ncbi:MAG: hypothetical protein OXG58_08205 [Gemmatimonadetes bacterium]|nr:hypothetical protein [Gemmatimonadota bacterium]